MANISRAFMLRYLSTNVVGGLHDSRLLNATWFLAPSPYSTRRVDTIRLLEEMQPALQFGHFTCGLAASIFWCILKFFIDI
jgi:hypothetical protein